MTDLKDSTKLDLDDYLPYLVNRVGSIIVEQYGGEALAPHQLNIAMWRVMAVLASAGSQRQIDLSDLTSIDASTLSRLVTRLSRLGFVTRTRSASSNREVEVKLSPKGSALVIRLIPVALSFETVAATGLSADELALVKRCLRQMYANMKSRNASRVEPTGPAPSGRPDDRLRETRDRRPGSKAIPGFR